MSETYQRRTKEHLLDTTFSTYNRATKVETANHFTWSPRDMRDLAASAAIVDDAGSCADIVSLPNLGTLPSISTINGNISITNSDNTPRELRLYEGSSGGSNYTGFKAPSTLGADLVLTLPDTTSLKQNKVLGLASDSAGTTRWQICDTQLARVQVNLNAAATTTIYTVPNACNARINRAVFYFDIAPAGAGRKSTIKLGTSGASYAEFLGSAGFTFDGDVATTLPAQYSMIDNNDLVPVTQASDARKTNWSGFSVIQLNVTTPSTILSSGRCWVELWGWLDS